MDLRRLVLLAVSLRGIIILAVLMLVGVHYLLSEVVFGPIATVESIKEQLKENKDIDINARNPDGFTGLQYAVIIGDVEMARLFLQYGADIDAKDTHIDDRASFRGNTALHLACFMGNTDNALEMIQLLLENDADVYARNDANETPLHKIIDIANLDRREAILKMLLDYGADINAQDKDGNTIIHMAVDRNDGMFIKYNREVYPSLINWNVRNRPAPITKENITTRVEPITSGGVVSTPTGWSGGTAEEWAIFKGFGFLVDNVFSIPVVIVGADGNVAATDQFGRTGLMLAILRGDYEFARNQVKLGADVNAQATDALRMRPIHYACWVDNPLAFVDMLLVQPVNELTPQVDVNAPNAHGDTALHIAVYIESPNERDQVMQRLLDKKINVYAQNVVGDTALHAAVRTHATKTVALLNDKYTYQIKNNDGLTPLELAQKLKFDDIVDILKPKTP